MSFSGLPKVLKDLLLSFAGHKCEACGIYDESKQCNDCKNHFCLDEYLHEDLHKNSPLCETCIQTYFKTCEICGMFQLPDVNGCLFCDDETICYNCLRNTYEGPACPCCFQKWYEEELC